MTSQIKIISSMATKQILLELSNKFQNTYSDQVSLESVGGVDAAKRVQAGEMFDVVVLASNVIDQLIGEGKIVGARVDLVKSGVAVVVKAGAPRPDISSEEGLKRAVSNAKSIGYSTGPSGTHLTKLFERWGIAAQIKDRIVQASPGVPVGTLVAKGEIEMGFQQLSELIHLTGVDILGPLPPSAQIITTFSGGIAASAKEPDVARAWLEFLASSEAAEVKRNNGMEPA
ncbi:MAG: substrate-binding domain-containing protein [Burkholderiales bacterium]